MQHLRRSWALHKDSKHNEASFSTTSMDLLYFRVALISRCSDLAIFVLTNRQTDRRTKPIALPLAHARGVIMLPLVAMWVASDQGGMQILHNIQPQGHLIDHVLCHMVSETCMARLRHIGCCQFT
jgi:hypothetical protein